MAKSLHNLTAFAGGEWSPKLDARVDQPKYGQALRACQNLIAYKTGGLTRRPGTRKIAQCKLANTPGHNYAVRTMKFIFSPTTTFDLEFGHNYVRFYSNQQQVAINSAQMWNAMGVYYPGNFVQDSFNSLFYYCIASVGPTSTHPNADPTHWVQQDIYEIPSPYTGDAGSSGSIWDTEVFVVVPCQINDVIYLAHPDLPVYSLTRFGDTDWVMQEVNFLAPALLDQNSTSTTIAASATTGSGVGLTATAPAWSSAVYYSLGNSVLEGGVIYNCVIAHVSGTFATDLANGDWVAVSIFNSNHVGSTWQLAYLRPSAYLEVDGTAASGFSDGTSSSIQALGSWEVHTYGVWSSDIAIERSLDGGNTWDTVRSVTGRSDRNVDITGTAVQLGLYRIVISNSSGLVNAGSTNPRVVFECVDSFLYGLVKITAVADAYHATATVVTQLASTSPTEYWSEAGWSDYRGYPQAVASFQQRLIYAASGFQPQRIWGTVTNDIENFALGDQTEATDAFAFDLNAPSRGPIQSLLGQTDLFAFFSGAEWVINSGATTSNGASAGGAITPTNIQALEHSSWGSAPNVQPVIVGDAALYTQRQATSIRQMMFSVYTEKYMSQDLTTLSDHLFAAGIVQLDYQTRWRKQSIIWVVTQQGTLCGLTYELDQEVFGWHRHVTGYGQTDPDGVPIASDNGFESVSVIDGEGTEDDQVWLVANRLIGGVQTRFIELLDPNNWEETFVGAPNPPGPVLADAFYVDCGMTINTPGSTTLTGLDYLDGRYVVGLADGNAFGPLLVTAGTVTLPAAIPSTVAVVQIGLPVRYQGQPMRIDMDARAGNTQALTKAISDLYIRVWNSMGGEVSNGGPQQPVKIPYTPNTGNPFAVPVLVTVPTDIRITPQLMPSPGDDPVFIVQGNDALPLTVLALILKYSVDGAP